MDHAAPTPITLHGHRRSRLYRKLILLPSSSCFKYSGERERLASRWRAAIAERHTDVRKHGGEMACRDFA